MTQPRAITCPIIITSCSTKSDGSLSIRCSTPELSADEKVAFMQVQNMNLKALFQPMESEPAELKEVKGQFDKKTPAQRLRATLFVLWKQADGTGEFEEFYRRRMEDIINKIKEKLEDK